MDGFLAYASFSKNEKYRLKSSSGGVFYELARTIICHDGVVYGVSFGEGYRYCEYMRVSNMNELDCILGSKYIQPRLGDTFVRVKHDLIKGLTVLFSGTGCIINGLKSFLGKEYENLYCVDVVCHGFPSPLVWEKYIDSIEKNNKTKVTAYDFRCKNVSWEHYGIKWTDSTNRVLFSSLSEDPYMQLYLRNISIRPSCFECQAKKKRLADISLGDFWGVDHVCAEMNDHKGISLVIVRTKHGDELFNSISNNLVTKLVNYEKAVLENPAEHSSVHRPSERDAFFSELNKKSFERLHTKIIYNSFKKRMKKKIKQSVIYNAFCGRKGS